MLYASDFRKRAFDALSGKWALAIGTGFIAALLGGTSGSSYRLSDFEWRDKADSFLDSQLLPFFLGIFTVAIIFGIVIFFIGGAVRLGYCRFNKNIIQGTNPQFGDLFSGFHAFWQAFLMQLLMGIFIFLWTLLLIIPGIIAAYSYAMTPYILDENPDMSVLDAISRSKEMMRGNKWRLFCLQISFIGWAILCVFTCGIGFLWLTPYVNAAEAAFYFEVSGYNTNNNYQGYNNNGYNNNGYNNNGYNNNGYNNNGYNNNGYNNNGYNNNGYNNNGYNNNGYNNNEYNNNGYNNNGYNNGNNNNGNNNNGYNDSGYDDNGNNNNGYYNNGYDSTNNNVYPNDGENSNRNNNSEYNNEINNPQNNNTNNPDPTNNSQK